jgi:hypothetical protein
MIECRHCRDYVSGDPEKIGARCPHCRMPLYERSPRNSYPVYRADGPRCGVHPSNPAVGPCPRCGTQMCVVCRTRWFDRPLCVACCVRARESREARPEEQKAHGRQAVLSVVFGLSGIILAVFGCLLLTMQGERPKPELAVLGALVVLTSFLPAFFGIGQGAAAIRARGPRMRLAASGLLLSSVQLGLLLGFLLLSVWNL